MSKSYFVSGGAIDRSELRRLLWDTGYSVNRWGVWGFKRVKELARDTLEEIFDEADRDKSGHVELKEPGAQASP